MPDEGFWASRPAPQDPVVAGRYRLPDPITGEDRSWTRASNYGYVIADQYGLTKWRHRQILRGLRMRPDLQQLLSVLDPDDTAKQDEMIETALQVAGTTTDANKGTAIHEALALADRGLDYPEWARPFVQGYHAELDRHGLEVVLVERLLLNRDRESAGRTDRVYRTADGRYVIGDVKSTGHLDLQAGEIAVQVENYGGASHLQADDGRMVPLDWPIDRDEAVIVHVDRDTGACAVYGLVMPLARYGTNLAQQVRGWHRMTRQLLVPYVRPGNAVPPAVAPTLAPLPTPAPTRPVDEYTVRHLQAVKDPGTMAVSGGLVDDHEACATAEDASATADAVKRAALLDQLPRDASGVMVGTPPAYEPQVPEPNLKTESQLMKLSKAQVQQYGRERGITDLAHNKPQLMKIFRAAGIVADAPGVVHKGTIVNTTTPAVETSISVSKANVPAGTDPQELPAGPIGNGQDPTDPRSEAFRRARLAEIGSAQHPVDLSRINQMVVRLGGDQAWDDEMAEATRERLAAIQEVRGTTGTQHDGEIMSRLPDCATSQDVADLWNEVTVGGSVPERWTAVVHQAAQARVAVIEGRTPPPPSNPFQG